MPLYPRPVDRDDTKADSFVVLCGDLAVGGWHRIASGPSEGHFRWTATLTASAGFVAGGFGTSAEDCKRRIGTAFRAMLARADLRERPDAKPGPPRRAPLDTVIETSGPASTVPAIRTSSGMAKLTASNRRSTPSRRAGGNGSHGPGLSKSASYSAV